MEDLRLAKILCLVPNLNYGSATTQLLHIAAHLGRPEHQLRVAALRGEAPVAPALCHQQVPVVSLSSGSHWDLAGLVRLRQLIQREKPDLIHVWGLAALRSLRLAVVPRCPVLLSNPLPEG